MICAECRHYEPDEYPGGLGECLLNIHRPVAMAVHQSGGVVELHHQLILPYPNQTGCSKHETRK